MKNAKTEEDKARMKDRWLQIDAEQNEEWLRKKGTGNYIDLSTIKKETCLDKSAVKSITDIKKC